MNQVGPMAEADTMRCTCVVCKEVFLADRFSTADRSRCPKCVAENRRRK
jgi:hypothetical protein